MSLLVVDPCGPAGLIKRCGGAAFQKPPAAYCTPCRSVQGSLSYSRASYLGGVEVDGLSKPRSRKSALSNPQRRNSLECKPQSSGPRLSGPGYSKPHWLVRKGRRKVAPCRAAAAAGAPVNSHEPAPVPKLIASVQAPSWIPNVPKQGVYRDLTFALIGAGFALVVAIFIGQWWTSQNLAMFNYRASDKVNTIPEPGPTGQKESVEWVNMVVGKVGFLLPIPFLSQFLLSLFKSPESLYTAAC